MRKKLLYRSGSLAVSTLLAFSGYAAAQSVQAYADSLASQLRRTVVLLSQPLRGKNLKFSADGAPQGEPSAGTWVADAGMLVESVSLKKNSLSIAGKRATVYFDRLGNRQFVVTGDSLRVEVALDDGKDSHHLRDTIGKVFLDKGHSPADVPPPEIPELEPGDPNYSLIVGQMPGGEPIYRASKEVVSPSVTRVIDPDYPRELRGSRSAGTVQMRVVVSPEGKVYSIMVTDSANPAFDSEAVNAVKQWEFSPASLNGKPVAMVSKIEVRFYTIP